MTDEQEARKSDRPGYKTPPKSHQFGQPFGSRPGVTKEGRRIQIENAERATRLRQLMLEAALAKAESGDDPQEVLEMLDTHLNTLMKDSENRGFGMPTQQVDNTSSDGSMSAPTKIIVQGVKPSEPDE